MEYQNNTLKTDRTRAQSMQAPGPVDTTAKRSSSTETKVKYPGREHGQYLCSDSGDALACYRYKEGPSGSWKSTQHAGCCTHISAHLPHSPFSDIFHSLL